MALVASAVHLGRQFKPFIVFLRPETAENTRFWKPAPKLGRPGWGVPKAKGLLSNYYELVCQLSSITCPRPTEQRQKGLNKILIYPNTETMTSATTQETQNEILKSRIMELQSALFFTESSSIVKLPTHVISDVELDNEGQIWFVIPMPAMNLEAYDKEIPTKLDFFKKGKDFFVKVRGIAFLQTDLKEANANSGLSAAMKERMNDTDLILVKVKVLDTEMVDNTPKPSQNWLQASRSQLSSWFF
jgi:hypothetical protein